MPMAAFCASFQNPLATRQLEATSRGHNCHLRRRYTPFSLAQEVAAKINLQAANKRRHAGHSQTQPRMTLSVTVLVKRD